MHATLVELCRQSAARQSLRLPGCPLFFERAMITCRPLQRCAGMLGWKGGASMRRTGMFLALQCPAAAGREARPAHRSRALLHEACNASWMPRPSPSAAAGAAAACPGATSGGGSCPSGSTAGSTTGSCRCTVGAGQLLPSWCGSEGGGGSRARCQGCERVGSGRTGQQHAACHRQVPCPCLPRHLPLTRVP